MKKLVLFAAMAAVMTACNTGKNNDDKLQQEYDSLEVVNENLSGQMDDYLARINRIQANIDSIKHLEGVISMQPVSETMSPDQLSQLEADINALNSMLVTNRQELQSLRSQLSQSGSRQKQLEQMVANLTQSIDQETERVRQLEAQLAEKNQQIAQLTDSLNQRDSRISDLSQENERKSSQLTEKDNQLATAYYVFGTRKELKDQGIINQQKKVLTGNFNRDYFVKIDARKTRTIALYSSVANVLTSHPAGSYSLDLKNGSYTLTITDPQLFWSISKFLVIEVN